MPLAARRRHGAGVSFRLRRLAHCSIAKLNEDSTGFVRETRWCWIIDPDCVEPGPCLVNRRS